MPNQTVEEARVAAGVKQETEFAALPDYDVPDGQVQQIRGAFGFFGGQIENFGYPAGVDVVALFKDPAATIAAFTPEQAAKAAEFVSGTVVPVVAPVIAVTPASAPTPAPQIIQVGVGNVDHVALPIEHVTWIHTAIEKSVVEGRVIDAWIVAHIKKLFGIQS